MSEDALCVNPLLNSSSSYPSPRTGSDTLPSHGRRHCTGLLETFITCRFDIGLSCRQLASDDTTRQKIEARNLHDVVQYLPSSGTFELPKRRVDALAMGRSDIHDLILASLQSVAWSKIENLLVFCRFDCSKMAMITALYGPRSKRSLHGTTRSLKRHVLTLCSEVPGPTVRSCPLMKGEIRFTQTHHVD